MVHAGGDDVRTELLDDVLGRAGERQLLDQLGRGQLDRELDVAARERLVDRLRLLLRDAVAKQLLDGHRRDVERDQHPHALACRCAVVGHAGDAPGAEVERPPIASGPLGADADVVGRVLDRLARVPERLVHAVGELSGELERLRSAHRADHDRHPLLHRARRREHAGAGVELALVLEHAFVEERAHHVVRLAQPGERAARSVLEVVLLEHREVADRVDQLGTPAGQLIEGRHRLDDHRRVAQDHVRDVRREDDLARPVSGRGEDLEAVLMERLVGAVDGVEPELVGDLDRIEDLGQRVVGQQTEADLHDSEASSASTSARSSSPEIRSSDQSSWIPRRYSRRATTKRRAPRRDLLVLHVLGRLRGIDLVGVIVAHLQRPASSDAVRRSTRRAA